MMLDELNEDTRKFLHQLFTETNGDISIQVSMYDIGSGLGLDRNDASKAAEELISWDLVEIRTLSGAIGITDAALKALEESGENRSADAEAGVSLGSEPVLTSDGHAAVAQTIEGLKQTAGTLGLSFDDLAEVMTDIKTIDTQMGSNRPKTAIIRECFRSMRECLDKAGAADVVSQIDMLMQE
jgi:hypothetical protein